MKNLIERDAEGDLVVPTLHPNLLHHEPQQPPTLLEVETVQTHHDAPGEGADALA